MNEPIFIVGIGGTMRGDSVTERAIAIALEAAEVAGARTLHLGGRDIELPSYRFDVRDRTPKARELVRQMSLADGLIIGSPAYHGGPSGLVKNALDYAEDLRNAPRPYWDGVAVGCVACAAGWQASVATLSALRSVAHSLRGWPTPLGVAINGSEVTFGEDGEASDPRVSAQLALMGRQVMEFALQRRALDALHATPLEAVA
ncbi:MAG: NADPH-dependent FMN reductase [Solirubrobacteraceae bacterium]